MNTRFERTGPLTELGSYPQWAQDMVADCEDVRQGVANHQAQRKLCEGTLGEAGTFGLMVGIWPVIERFPAYMAQSLVKTRYGRSPGDDLARRWLVRNIRVEQNHAKYWIDWAEGAGVTRDEILNGAAPRGTEVLANWCEEASKSDSLAAGIAATNYAVEGATGDWAGLVYKDQGYIESFPKESRARSLRWLELHAAYDDTHPWEALEIVCTLMGEAPAAREVAHIGECIKRSYTSMRILLDICAQAQFRLEVARKAVA